MHPMYQPLRENLTTGFFTILVHKYRNVFLCAFGYIDFLARFPRLGSHSLNACACVRVPHKPRTAAIPLDGPGLSELRGRNVRTATIRHGHGRHGDRSDGLETVR